MIDTILFDMDGTITDTQKVYSSAWRQVGLSEEELRTMVGRSSIVNHRYLEELGYDADALIAKKNAICEKVFSEGIDVKPGAREALEWLRKEQFACVLATSSPLARAEKNLAMTDLARYFDFVVSGNVLERGKPFPDVFLMAAREAGKIPSQCLVVEDSFNGVRAGKAAGMKTVMIPDAVPPDAEMKKTADAILPSLKELPACIEALQQEEAAEERKKEEQDVKSGL